MSTPWKTPEGWSKLACEIAWTDYIARIDGGEIFDCSLVVIPIGACEVELDELRERCNDLPGVADEDLTAALLQIGCDVDMESVFKPVCWPDADTAMRAWRAVGAMPDPADTWVEAIEIVESEPEYPDAPDWQTSALEDLRAHGVTEPEYVFGMLVFFGQHSVRETKRCIADRMRKAAGGAS